MRRLRRAAAIDSCTNTLQPWNISHDHDVSKLWSLTIHLHTVLPRIAMTLPHIPAHPLAILCLMCLACDTPGASAPADAPAHRRGAFAPDQPVQFAVPDTVAPWVAPVMQEGAGAQLRPNSLVTFGDRVSIHETPRGYWAVDANDGVLGQIAPPPRANWLGVDGRGRIWAARRGEGVMWRAPDARAALNRDSFDQLDVVEGATTFDVNRDLVVAGVEDRVLISGDGGQSWKTRYPFMGPMDRGELPMMELTLKHVFARYDGVVVAMATDPEMPEMPMTVISRDRGQSWELSTFQPKSLTRHGAFIWNGDVTCPAVLTKQAIYWNSDPRLSDVPGYRDPRGEMLSLVTTTVAPAAGERLATLSEPDARTDDPDKRHAGMEPSCLDPIPTAEDLARAEARRSVHRGRGRGLRGAACEGVQCLQAASAPQTSRYEMMLFADAACAAEADDCPGETEAARPPHASIFDRARDILDITEIPRGCLPHRLSSVRGLNVLVCRGDPATVWTRPWDDVWRYEAELPASHTEVGEVSAAADGTIFMHSVCAGGATPESCSAGFLRRPVASGADRVWMEVDVPHALTALPIPGNEVLIAAAPDGATSAMTIWRVTDGRSVRPMLTVEGIEAPVRQMRLDEAGRLTLMIGEAMAAQARVVLGDGRVQ